MPSSGDLTTDTLCPFFLAINDRNYNRHSARNGVPFALRIRWLRRSKGTRRIGTNHVTYLTSEPSRRALPSTWLCLRRRRQEPLPARPTWKPSNGNSPHRPHPSLPNPRTSPAAARRQTPTPDQLRSVDHRTLRFPNGWRTSDASFVRRVLQGTSVLLRRHLLAGPSGSR